MPKARTVMKALREQILPLKPEIVFTGHDARTNGVEFLEDVLAATDRAIHKTEARRNQ